MGSLFGGPQPGTEIPCLQSLLQLNEKEQERNVAVPASAWTVLADTPADYNLHWDQDPI